MGTPVSANWQEVGSHSAGSQRASRWRQPFCVASTVQPNNEKMTLEDNVSEFYAYRQNNIAVFFFAHKALLKSKAVAVVDLC